MLTLVSPTGAANENGKIAEDSETIPDQTAAEGGGAKPADEPAAAATSADSTAAAAPAGEEPAASPPAEAEAPAPADSTAETAASPSEPAAPEQGRLESKPAMFATL